MNKSHDGVISVSTFDGEQRSSYVSRRASGKRKKDEDKILTRVQVKLQYFIHSCNKLPARGDKQPWALSDMKEVVDLFLHKAYLGPLYKQARSKVLCDNNLRYEYYGVREIIIYVIVSQNYKAYKIIFSSLQ